MTAAKAQSGKHNGSGNLTRVAIVDDSSMTRYLMQQFLDSDPEIEVIGGAANAQEARQLIKQESPDVITLDVEMPGMNGIDFLRNLMRFKPMPVVMVSSLTEKGAEVTLDAFSLGAFDVVSKPKSILSDELLAEYVDMLTGVVKAAGSANLASYRTQQLSNTHSRLAENTASTADTSAPVSPEIIVLGASTGGTEAIPRVLADLPADGPGVIVVQHISSAFNRPFARRLNQLLPLTVCSATDGEPVRCGHVYVAPAGCHLELKAITGGYACQLTDVITRKFHKPSVDVLFESAAKVAGSHAVGVLLTGMGADGVHGMKKMREAGAVTIAQNEATSVIWGMPGSAVKAGAAQIVASLETIAGYITVACKGAS
jgi:two-component system chemotaxis response regulator CheB